MGGFREPNRFTLAGFAKDLESPTDDVSLNCSGEPGALPEDVGPAYEVAETHTDGADVTVSNIEVESEGETVVPDAHYAVDIEGVDTDGGYVILSNVYDENTLEEGADGSLWRGAAVGENYGFFLEMPRVESTSVYMDVVTEDGEVHRYLVEVCREDV